MKKIAFLLVFSMLFLVACQADGPAQTEASDPTDLLAGKSKQTVLEEFTSLFNELGSYYNQAIRQRFTSPTHLNLLNLFYLGFEGESKKPTQEEQQALADLLNSHIGYDLFRLPAGKMNRVLKQYFGVTLEQMRPECFDGLVYLESTDCYYYMNIIGGFAQRTDSFRATDYQVLEDGTVVLTYTENESDFINILAEDTIGLKPNGDRWQVLYHEISHVSAEPIDLNLFASYITQDGEVKDAFEMNMVGRFLLLENGEHYFDGKFIVPDTFRYRPGGSPYDNLFIPISVDGSKSDVYSGTCLDRGSAASMPYRGIEFSLDKDRKCLIMKWNLSYLVASTDPDMAPLEILEHFSWLVERWDEMGFS